MIDIFDPFRVKNFEPEMNYFKLLSYRKSIIISNQKETIQALKIQVRCLTKEMIEMENTIKSKVECIHRLVGIIAQERFSTDFYGPSNVDSVEM